MYKKSTQKNNINNSIKFLSFLTLKKTYVNTFVAAVNKNEIQSSYFIYFFVNLLGFAFIQGEKKIR